MTKEELEKYIVDFMNNETGTDWSKIDSIMGKMLLKYAEVFQKRIVKLGEHLGKANDRIVDLEAQLEREKNLNQCLSDHNEQLRELIEKMKCCGNCDVGDKACYVRTQEYVNICPSWKLKDKRKMTKRDKRLKTIKKIRKLVEKIKKVYFFSPIYNEEVNITLRWNRYRLAIGNNEDTTGEIYTF